MADLIDLTDLDLPDCQNCTEPTKRISGRTFDVEGPGVPGVAYRCENRQCRNRRNQIGSYIMRKGGASE